VRVRIYEFVPVMDDFFHLSVVVNDSKRCRRTPIAIGWASMSNCPEFSPEVANAMATARK
jgi:hypothetical protein